MGRGWALLVAASLTASCGPTPAPEPGVGYAEQEPWPLPQVAFETKTDQVEISLRMDPAIQRYPALHGPLKADAESRLKAFAVEMTAERREGLVDRAPYAMDILWAAGGVTARLASIEGFESQYTGGNHPDGRAYAILWDRAAQRKIEPLRLFRPASDEALRVLLCRRLTTEKQRRVPYMRTVPLAEIEHDECAWSMADVPFILAPAIRGEKAAGILYLLGPGQGGGYAAGAFRIFVPTAALRPLLADEYADQFSENPRRL